MAIQHQLKICRVDQLFLISMLRIMLEKDIMWRSSEQIAVREQKEPGITAIQLCQCDGLRREAGKSGRDLCNLYYRKNEMCWERKTNLSY